MKNTIAAIALAGLSTAVCAGGFDGFNVDLGIGGAGTSTKVSGSDQFDVAGGPTFNGTTNSGSFNGMATLGYSQEIADSGFNLAANLFYVIGNQKSGALNNGGNFTDTNGDSLTLNQNVQNVSMKNTWGISVEPGWNFGKTTLGYAKLAWVNSNLNSTATVYGYNNTTSQTADVNGSQSFNKNVNGFGYGIGAKQLITDNLYLKAEVMGVSYGSASFGDGAYSNKPTQVMGFASIGYKF